MGFFSWKTSDTNKIITHRYSKSGALPVYLVCPDNTLIYEPDYEGYGEFAGMDAYALLAKWNLPTVCNGNPEDDRYLGIRLEDSIIKQNRYAKAKNDLIDILLSSLHEMACTESPNTHIHDLINEISKLKEKFEAISYPLKFVEDPKNCIYDNLPPSEIDGTQGYGIDEEWL